MLASLHQQSISFWKKQSLAKQITVASLIAAALILTPVLVSWANTPTYSVAYNGLSESDAAQIVQKLDENNVPYRLQSSGTIEVPADQVYSTRLLMAREGLPESNTVGYELFSGSSMLGMTEFSQQVNYQRAVVGELERTIGSLEAVKAVRVHLVTPEKSLLTSEQTLSTASVTIQVNPGQALEATQVQAITHLVASSVEGLKPENVVVVDSKGNMLANGMGSEIDTGLTVKDEQRAIEKAYALEVQKRVQTILDKILGPNRSIVQAAVEMDWTQREVTSNMYEPTQVAVRSSQVVNESSTSGETTGGVPGAETNLPEAEEPVTENDATTYQRSEETFNYEISQIQSHEVVTPGQVVRISVSVMVDGITDQEQLDAIESAVQAAAGIDTVRGDQVVVESFAFDRTALDELSADLAKQQQEELYIRIGTGVGAALVVLAILFFVLRMINNMRNASKESWKAVLRPVSEMAQLPAQSPELALKHPAGASAPVSLPSAEFEEPASRQDEDDVVVQLTSRSNHSSAPEDEQRSRIISRLAEENPATVAEIIQIWLNEGKK